MATVPDPGESIHAAVGFVDMAGFTAMTEVHGDRAAADMSEQLAEITAAALDGADRLVKTLGDAVLFTSPSPASALAVLRRILQSWSGSGSRPILRGGIHYGPILVRNNDVYGNTVNVAARIAAAAARDQILVTAAVAAAAKTEGVPVVALGPRLLRNVAEPVPVFALDDLDCLCSRVDPVCRMYVPSLDAITVEHHDTVHYFCSADCAQRFDREPDRYATPPTAR